jgi:hypothetical protein
VLSIPANCSSPTRPPRSERDQSRQPRHRSTPLPGIGPVSYSFLIFSATPSIYRSNPRSRLFPTPACKTNPTVPSARLPRNWVRSFISGPVGAPPHCAPGPGSNPDQPLSPLSGHFSGRPFSAVVGSNTSHQGRRWRHLSGSREV